VRPQLPPWKLFWLFSPTSFLLVMRIFSAQDFLGGWDILKRKLSSISLGEIQGKNLFG
jgi:hypothetical protein